MTVVGADSREPVVWALAHIRPVDAARKRVATDGKQPAVPVCLQGQEDAEFVRRNGGIVRV
jgi:hypothetical protein